MSAHDTNFHALQETPAQTRPRTNKWKQHIRLIRLTKLCCHHSSDVAFRQWRGFRAHTTRLTPISPAGPYGRKEPFVGYSVGYIFFDTITFYLPPSAPLPHSMDFAELTKEAIWSYDPSKFDFRGEVSKLLSWCVRSCLRALPSPRHCVAASDATPAAH
jgi:hypothetical protein